MSAAASSLRRAARALAAASTASMIGAAAVAVAVAGAMTPPSTRGAVETRPGAVVEAAPSDQVAAVPDPQDDVVVAAEAASPPEVADGPSPPTTVVAPPIDAPATAAVAAPSANPAPSPEERGREAMAFISYPVDRVGYRISFVGPRNGYLGLTSTTAKTITIYVRPTQTTLEIAKIVAHELGHAVDVEFTDDGERALYRQIRGIDGRSWYPTCSGCTDYSSVAGDFAEVFARWLLGDVSFVSTVTAAPTAAQLAALGPIFTV
ncbi:MAG TPA: hypothetical protein VM345_17485 [Acidimicrobiales bacterium]|nr:hypothetical protein [Acidimicrobiales bacterium]